MFWHKTAETICGLRLLCKGPQSFRQNLAGVDVVSRWFVYIGISSLTFFASWELFLAGAYVWKTEILTHHLSITPTNAVFYHNMPPNLSAQMLQKRTYKAVPIRNTFYTFDSSSTDWLWVDIKHPDERNLLCYANPSISTNWQPPTSPSYARALPQNHWWN